MAVWPLGGPFLVVPSVMGSHPDRLIVESVRKQHACVFGLGWGDEGKGKLVDLLCPSFGVVVRYNGGANAGHTVCVGREKFALHLLPTGVLHDSIIGVIGPGVVVDPIKLLAEIDGLAERGIYAASRLKISERAHLVLAYHQIEDQLSERAAGDKSRIGTTARGIGPCYADKMKRTTAVRFADLLHDPHLPERLRRIVEARRATFSTLYGDDGAIDVEAIIADLTTAKQRLAPLICDTTQYLHEAIEGETTILFEGANGMLLDVDHGTYPFVTSSSTGPHGIGPGAGVFPSEIGLRIGVCKAYATRVGSGPFASELDDAIGDRIREQGNEFGTTTGRPRRCGWFDAVACRYTARVSGATHVAVMHLDTLSGFQDVGVCVAYRLDGETITTPPADVRLLERIEPIIELVPGWPENLRSIRRFEDLPDAAQRYVLRLESLVGAPISIIGIGPDRSQTLVRGDLRSIISVPEASAR